MNILFKTVNKVLNSNDINLESDMLDLDELRKQNTV